MNERIDYIQNSIDTLLGEFSLLVEPGGPVEKVTTSLDEYGTELGQSIREYLVGQGLVPNLSSLLKSYGCINFCQGKACVTQSGIEQYRITHYTPDDSCLCTKNIQLGNLMCQLDRAVLKGFNPDLMLEIVSSLKIGSESCWFESDITHNEERCVKEL